jgi:hypothetical protein
MKKIYARVTADYSIAEVTEPRATAPGHVNHCVWQEVVDDAPAHNPDLHERHSPRFVWDGHRVHRRFEIRRKAE